MYIYIDNYIYILSLYKHIMKYIITSETAAPPPLVVGIV